MDLRRLQTDPAEFRRCLHIDADGTPRRLGDVLDPWQASDFAALDGGWKRAAGLPADSGCSRAYLERPRGASKTTDLATMATWILFASRRAVSGIASAADRDQARLLRDSIAGLVRLNPWLASILDVQAYAVVNKHTSSRLEIISSDSGTSYGLTPDFLIVDELTHWRDESLWVSLFSAIAKRANAMLCIISNAGMGQGESWQWNIREAARQSPDWHFSRLDRPASWISEQHLSEQRRLLPRLAYDRLWRNLWTSGSGDALTPEDIDGALQRGNRQEAMGEGWAYVAGLDLGLSRDASALVIVGKHTGHVKIVEAQAQCLSRSTRILIELGELDAPCMLPTFEEYPGTGRLRVVDVKVWRPEGGRKVDIGQIETAIVEASERYEGLRVGFDPYQAMYLAERLRGKGVQTEQVDFIGANLKSMCSATLEAFSEGTIDICEHPQLVSDLRALRVEERQYGVRLVSPRGPGGHGDAATGLAIALHLARQTREVTSTRLNRPLLCFP